MNVLHLLHRTPVTSGPRSQMLDAARGIAQRGGSVLVVTTPDDGVTRRCKEAGIPYIAQRLRHPLDVAAMRFVAGIVKERSIDVVHTHCGVSLGVALGAAALGARVALVAERSTSFRPRRLVAQALASARLQRVITPSRRVREIVLAGTRLPPEKVVVVPGSVDLQRFDPARAKPQSARTNLGVPASAPLIGHVGVREWKGWKHALAVLPIVRAIVPDARLALVGCTSERQRRTVLAFVGEVGLTDHVAVGLATEDIQDILTACQVVIDPSWAGTGVSAVVREAMALARPVVATDIGGNAELIEDGTTGLLVPSRDAVTMAAAVARLLRDTELAGRLGQAARDSVRSELTVELRAVRLAGVYRAAIEELAATPAPG